MDLKTRSQELFAPLAQEGFGGRFHSAAVDRPGELSAVTSAHYALALRHIDAAAAADELRALFAACQVETGLVMRSRSLATDPKAESNFIAPPVAAFASARLVLAGDASLRDLLECATRELDAIWGERLPPDTDLPVILHPWESATPGSPLFDDVVEVAADDDGYEELATLARSAVACGLDPDRALRAGHAFVVEDPVFCGWFLLALEEARSAWEKLGDSPSAQKLAIRSRMIAEAIRDRLWWEEEEVFAARDRQRDDALQTLTLGGLLPAASRLLQEDGKGRRAIARHLAPGGSALWGSRGIAYNPIVRDRAPDPRSPWRGNACSALTQYWAHLALVRAGRSPDARVARSQLESLVDEHGFCEFYDATSGEGHGSKGTPLPAIMLEMEAQEE